MEVYGRGNWDAIGIFVPSRSQLQIEEHGQQSFTGVEDDVDPQEVRVHGAFVLPRQTMMFGFRGLGVCSEVGSPLVLLYHHTYV